MEHSNKKYWKGYEELHNTPEFKQSKNKEFVEQLPVLSELANLAKDQTANRRDFLKVMGFGLSAATVAASCEIPLKKIIPYVNKPEEIVPGIANYYASTFVNGNDYCSVLVKTREGRPIKIEGNALSSLTKGGTTSRAQASIISLYDGARLRYPAVKKQKTTWENIDNEIKNKLATAGNIAIVSSSISSPSIQKAIAEFKGKYPTTKHVVYEAVSNAAITYANEQMYGKKVIPAYHFDKAQTIVSLGADFLGTWISPLEFTKQYAQNRTITKDSTEMSKVWSFESYLSLTGSNADKRFTIKPSQEGIVAVALYNELAKLTGAGTAPADLKDPELQKAVTQLALELKENAGKSLVVSGSNDTNTQIVVNTINQMLGNYGRTVDLDSPYNIADADDKSFNELVDAMNAGQVGAVIIYNANPAYSYPNAEKFISGLKKVPTSISFNDREDETTEHTTYYCPDSHYLESWGDAEVRRGYYSLMQPTISQLFETRSALESLLRWAGNNATAYDYVKANWQAQIYGTQSKFTNFDAFWEAALHDGVYETANPNALKGADVAAMYNNTKEVASIETPVISLSAIPALALTAINTAGKLEQAAQAIASTASKAGAVEVKLYENTTIGNGKYANNPFLQETPEPISKTCWGNVLSVSKSYALSQGWGEGDVIELKAGNTIFQLPVIFQPGVAEGVAAIALGYGRTKAGTEYCNVGANAYPLVSFNGQTFDYTLLTGATLNKVANKADTSVEVEGNNIDKNALVRTQTHATIDDKREIINETTFAEYKLDKWAGNHAQQHRNDHSEDHFFTLYGRDKKFGSHKDFYTKGLHWNMSIDLTACIGCGACVPACHIENNVPIVGKKEVFRSHEMHWMRIDRYYSGNENNPDVTFMPMMCHHCDNAPCENVCPVAATNHSSEGINQMAYNRCIGTRYCANNCPYKVRRFNWFDYQAADSFYKGTIFDNDERALVDDLTRMVLNPDVTVRSRGVIEKCSFCVQRLQEGKLNAKKESRTLTDNDAKTACQQACPTNAIVFGNNNNPESAVSQRLKDTRTYYLLEDLHIVPNVSYLTKIRNRDASPESLQKASEHAKNAHGHDAHKNDAHKNDAQHPADTHTEQPQGAETQHGGGH